MGVGVTGVLSRCHRSAGGIFCRSGKQASCHLVLMPQLLSKAIKHMGNVSQPSPAIQRAPISQPPPGHTLHPQQGQCPGLPEGGEVPLGHVCVHVLVESGGRSRSLARRLCSQPHQTRALPSSPKAGPHSWAEAGSLSPCSMPCQGWPLSQGPPKGYLEPMTILTTPGASPAMRAICPGRSSKEARSVKEKRKRKASVFSLQAWGGEAGSGTRSRDHAITHLRN